MTTKKQYLIRVLELNLATLLISTSGPLGKYIALPPMLTILCRALLAVFFLYLFCKFKRYKLKLNSPSDTIKILFNGFLMGGHWVLYFYALQLSNVAIGMLSIFTYPVITAFLEPIILKTKFQSIHILLAILVLLGIYFLVPDFSFENRYTIAVLCGIASAFCYALRNLFMKPHVKIYNGSVLMLYQLIAIALMTLPALFLYPEEDVVSYGISLIMLALITTTMGHTLFLMSFRHFSITTASIISSIQPVYGIILGMLFLSEFPAITTLLGGAMIIVAVIVESLRTLRQSR
ncbi:DMT family transporter [Sungkyunkwania multivorans]|uniref:DMT family transporter n=1 Tax=Sungkyunkwania multivorans TaxID=1173618 RepID=A0ABW3CXS2_9FLAO